MGERGFQMILSERHSESVRFVRIERHVPSVGPACDFFQICREWRGCCVLSWGIPDGTTEGGLISKEIKRIFQSWRDHWWKPEKEQGPELYLEELQLGEEERMRELHLGPHGDCDRRGSLRAMSGDVLGYHRKRVWWAGEVTKPYWKHAICLGIWLCPMAS